MSLFPINDSQSAIQSKLREVAGLDETVLSEHRSRRLRVALVSSHDLGGARTYFAGVADGRLISHALQTQTGNSE